MKRREFLKKSMAGLGGLLLHQKLLSAQQTKPRTFDPYELVPLGKTNLKVSRVGFGTGMRGWARQSNQTRLGKENFESLIRAAFERGVRLFDTADMYGSHPFIVPALKKIPREKYVIVSKMWLNPFGLPKEESRDPKVVIERFLKELNTDYIDLLLLHCLSLPNWPGQMADQMADLAKFKKKGLIRAHGVSIHSFRALESAIEEPWVDSVHARINAYGTHMDAAPEKVAPVLEKIHQAGKGLIAMKLIGQGDFRNSDEKRDKSISYVLNLGSVDAMVIGFEKLTEIDDFAARVRKVTWNTTEKTSALDPSQPLTQKK